MDTKNRSEAAPFCGCILRSHSQKLLRNGTLNKRMMLLFRLCACIQLLSGYTCCSWVHGPFPDSGIIVHEAVPNTSLSFSGSSPSIPPFSGKAKQSVQFYGNCILRFIRTKRNISLGYSSGLIAGSFMILKRVQSAISMVPSNSLNLGLAITRIAPS